MDEFIIGLGISVKICKLYEELVYLTFSNSNMTREYFDNVEKLKGLIEEETRVYDALSPEDIDKYLEKIDDDKKSEFDAVKSRYYSKLNERKKIFDNCDMHGYPFTLETAIIGKILLKSLTNIEKQFLLFNSESDKILYDGEKSIYNLYAFHNTYKFSLIASNEFLEKIVTDFDFQLSAIPNVGFDRIKINFGNSKMFDIYLNNLLVALAKNIMSTLVIETDDNEDINKTYSALLAISQLEVIISYLDIDSLYRLNYYYKENDIDKSKNGKYIRRMLTNKLRKK